MGAKEEKVKKRNLPQWCGPCEAFHEGNLSQQLQDKHNSGQASAGAAGRYYKAFVAAAEGKAGKDSEETKTKLS